jgi:hypothetical protein
VVLAGVTVAEPDKARGVALMLGLPGSLETTLTDVALALLQVSVAEPPPLIVVGVAVRVTVGVDGSVGGGLFLLPPQPPSVSASSTVVRAPRARPRWSFLYMAEAPRGMLILANRK